ncbi:MAG: hypothetical protein F6K36_28370 [Symploca sp. SIO3C6]|nr:hypothetical protein [Symploca sp. SIO3C6]
MNQIRQSSLFQEMWTRAYFVSTAGNLASSTIQKYIDAQGKN